MNHFPSGWAAAFSTPFQMFKRYSEYAGGTCGPLVISWPKGIKARGEVRNQYHHSVDIVPTILDSAAWKCRRFIGVSSSIRSPGFLCVTPLTPGPTPTQNTGSITPCSAPAPSGKTAGRRLRCMLRS